jgi:hypothetical protein
VAPDCCTELLLVEQRDTIVESDCELLVVTEEEQVVLVDSGMQGPPGPPGQTGVSYLQFVASGALGGHRVVRLSGGDLVYASNTETAFANAPLGLTIGATAPGATASVQTSGLMTEPSWAWTPEQPVFVGPNGVPVQPSPATGYSLIVGIATSPTQILIGARMPIIQE